MIQFKHSMVIDVICALTRHAYALEPKNPELEDMLSTIRRRIAHVIDDNESNQSFSDLGAILIAYTDSKKIEEMTLDELHDIFSAPEELKRIVKPRIKSEFMQSVLFPCLDRISDGWGAYFCRLLDALKQIEFEEIWRQQVLPIVRADIFSKKSDLEKRNVDAKSILSDINKRGRLTDRVNGNNLHNKLNGGNPNDTTKRQRPRTDQASGRRVRINARHRDAAQESVCRNDRADAGSGDGGASWL